MYHEKLIFLSLMAICFCVRLYAQTNFKYKNASLPVEVRVQDLLSRMTLEEKLLKCAIFMLIQSWRMEN